MKKRLLSMLLPLCCLGFTAAYAQSEDPADVSQDKEVTVSTDQPTAADDVAAPTLYKKGNGCGCGGKPKA